MSAMLRVYLSVSKLIFEILLGSNFFHVRVEIATLG